MTSQLSNLKLNDRSKLWYSSEKQLQPEFNNVSSQIQDFHSVLPGYNPTPLVAFPEIAKRLGLKQVYIKDESHRFDLKAFKILGASWGIYCALKELLFPSVSDTDIISLESLGSLAQAKKVVLLAASDGNHGRAVARMASWLGIQSHIFVPAFVSVATRDRIMSEQGAQVVVVSGDYDAATMEAWAVSQNLNGKGDTSLGMLIQDNAFEGYTEGPPEV
jgi:diaminopropionate ammonia-lyase